MGGGTGGIRHYIVGFDCYLSLPYVAMTTMRHVRPLWEFLCEYEELISKTNKELGPGDERSGLAGETGNDLRSFQV